MIAPAVISQPYEVVDIGDDKKELQLRFHEGQWNAWDSEARFVIILAGTQGGKTSFGPHWLYREIQERGPGDYMVVTPTYKLLSLKALPEFKRIFKTILGLGEYKAADKVFEFDAVGEIRTWGQEQTEPTRVLFGYATDPDSLESATAKAAWLDEAGQTKFKLPSYKAILRRLSLAQGRVLVTTTLYNLGWIKQLFWDKQHEDDDIDVFRFDSTMNPAFPQEEMDRAKDELPLWEFNMFYRAIFARPAGMIYDCFDDAFHKVPAFTIPTEWPRYLGLDFGGVNTAGVFIAQELGDDEKPTGKMYAYREYHAGGRTAKEHKKALLVGEPGLPMAYGGAGSEGQWRSEFGQAGLGVAAPPIKGVEIGINRVYGAFKLKQLFILDTLPELLDELMSYARKLDDMGKPIEEIADKATYHKLDALRYIIASLRGEPAAIVENPFYK